MRKFQLNFLLFLLALFAFVSTATAQYRSENWTTENGLPQNSVTAILQAKDGYIWFGTFGGLVRFDGIKFKIFNTINAPAIKSNRITGLFEGKDGTIWIGTQYGNLISYKDEIFTSVLEPPTTSRAGIGVICVDRDGSIWFIGGSGVQKFKTDDSGKYVTENIELPDEKNPHIGSIVEDEAGSVWISTTKGLYQSRNGELRSFPYNNILPTIVSTKLVAGGFPAPKIFIDRNQRFWITAYNYIARFENGKFIPLIENRDGNFIVAENIDGSFFVKSEGKVYRFADDKLGDLLIDDSDKFGQLRVLMSDREGNLWAGTTGFGLLRYKQQTARTFSKADGITDSDTYFVFEDRDKNLWVGADNLYKFRDDKFENVSETIKQPFVWAFQTKDGTLWFGIQSEELLTYQNGKFTNFSQANNIEAKRVFEDSKGTLWFPTTAGLIALRDGKREQFPFPNVNVQSIYEDREGKIWFATINGLSYFKDGVFMNYSTKDGLSNDNVRDIYEDRDGVLWFGTYGGGLNRFKDGKFFAITTNEGMNEDIVSRIVVDANDTFWMLGNRGVSVISRSALNDLSDGKIKTIACASYGVSDGMKTSEGNGGNFPAGWQAGDGRFWFPSIQGVIAIDPKFSDLPPPPVFIEDVFISGKQIEARPEIEIAPELENLEIHYTGLNFTKPEQVKFKYKLEGFDSDWIEVGTRRTAYYTQIPAGNYRFLVTASTTNGVWNEQPAAKNVIVLSNPIWKKPWFILSVSVLLILVLITFYRLRLQQMGKIRHQQQEFSRQLIKSQENERKRIAGEIHDGLGQTLLIIKNRAFLGARANNLEAANEQLSEISTSSGAAINQAREIAYFLRPSQLERLGLTSALEEMLREVSESSEIVFEYEIDSIDDFFSVENEINFYRVVQESVNNILKHSNAAKAKVFVTRKVDKIELSVQDNGKGFAKETTKIGQKSGFGLFGIEERVRILGGRHSIQSEIGGGTKVFVTIEKQKNE